MESLASSRIVLKAGVFLATGDEQGILMDIVDDRYWAIDGEATAIWRQLASGASADEVAAQLSANGERSLDEARADVHEQLSAWLAAGLARAAGERPELPQSRRTDGRATKRFVPTKVYSWSSWIAGGYSVIKAKRWVSPKWRERGLDILLGELQRSPGEPTTASFQDCVSATVRTFELMRVPFRQGKQDCLERSLQLARALRLNGLDALLCIGVRRLPFQAHAWVELEGHIVADSIAATTPFQVIARF